MAEKKNYWKHFSYKDYLKWQAETPRKVRVANVEFLRKVLGEKLNFK